MATPKPIGKCAVCSQDAFPHEMLLTNGSEARIWDFEGEAIHFDCYIKKLAREVLTEVIQENRKLQK